MKTCPKCHTEYKTEEELREKCESIGIFEAYEELHPDETMELFNCKCGTTMSLIKKKVEDVLNTNTTTP